MTSRRSIVIGALAAMLFPAVAIAQPTSGPRPVIPAGNDDYFRSLLGKFAHGIGGHRFAGAKIDSERVEYSFRAEAGSFQMVLEHPSSRIVSPTRSKHFAVSFEFSGVDGPAREVIARALSNEVSANDVRDIWDSAGAADVPDAPGTAPPWGPAALVLLMVFGTMIAIGLSGRIRVPMLGALESARAAAERFAFPLTLCLVLTAAFLRFHNADMPLFDGGSIERLFIASLDPLRNLVSPYDPRHPGLYFAIMHFPLKLSGFSVWPVQCIGLVFSVVSVLLAGAVVRRHAGVLGAVPAMALVSVSPELIQRGREVTDLGLFVMLALAALLFYQRVLDAGRRSDKVVLAAALGLSLLSSYAALLVAAALVLHAVVDPGRRRALAWPLGAALAIGLPVIVRISASIPIELSARQRADEYAGVLWGGWGTAEFAYMTARALFSQRAWAVALIVIVVALAVARGELRQRGPLVVIALLNVALASSSAFFRIRPYYAIFLQVSLFLLVTSMCEAPPGREFASFETYARRLAPIAAAMVLYMAYAIDLGDRWEPIYIQASNFEEDIRGPVHAAESDGAKEIVVDINHDKIPVIYRFFKKPFESMRNYYVREGAPEPCAPTTEFAFVCEDAGSERRLLAITEGADPGPNWQGRAVGKLKTLLAAAPRHVLYNTKHVNEPFRAFLDSKCEKRHANKKYLLFFCRG